MCDEKKRIWIPMESMSLRMRIIVIAHCASAGHRGMNVTHDHVHQKFEWKTLRADVNDFVAHCLHCVVIGDTKVPSLGEAVHGAAGN